MDTTAKTFSSVQALRGLAALAVVIYHGDLATIDAHLDPIFSFKGGEAGVDLFFAISGCVMVMSTAKFWGDPASWRIFLLRRLIRIVPLYWLFTLLKMGSVVFVPGVIRHTVLDWNLIICSFFFIPAWVGGHTAVGQFLTVGWTLSYEMFFYLLFALSLGLCRRPVLLLLPLLTGLACLGFFRTPGWGAPATLIDPILLEFVFGIVIALAVRGGHILPVIPAMVLGSAMLLVLMTFPYHPLQAFLLDTFGANAKDDIRFIGYGVPSALLLYAAMSLEKPLFRWFSGFPSLLGDASYSIYLSHAFITAPLGIAWQKLHWTGSASAYCLVAVCVVVAILVGMGVHGVIENPLLHYLNRKVRQPDPVGIGTRS